MPQEFSITPVGFVRSVRSTPVIDIKPALQGFLPRASVRQPDWAEEIMASYWDAPAPES